MYDHDTQYIVRQITYGGGVGTIRLIARII